MAKMNKSNLYRKVRALLSKTVANGCTPGEALSAYELAEQIVTANGLDRDHIVWPQKPSAAAVAMKEAAAEMAEKAPKAEKPTKTKRGDRIIELMRRPEGVSIYELVAEFGTKPHTCRAQISVETRKRGLKAILIEGRYHIAP